MSEKKRVSKRKIEGGLRQGMEREPVAGAAISSDWLINFNTPSLPSFIVNQKDGERSLNKIVFHLALDDCLQDFPEQEICLVNLARGKDVLAILPTKFPKKFNFSALCNTG